MRATIDADHRLHLIPETELESFALDKWKDELLNGRYQDTREPDALDKLIVLDKI